MTLRFSENLASFKFIVIDIFILNTIVTEGITNKYISWISFGILSVLFIYSIFIGNPDRHRYASIFIGLSVIFELLSLSFYLIIKLFTKNDGIPEISASRLFIDALILWLANILLFTVFYWLMDGGGPVKRSYFRKYSSGDDINPYLWIDSNGKINGSDFLFPLQDRKDVFGWYNWKPGMIDYFFLAFSTSTAFSSTDTLILTPRSKLFTVIQSIISLLSITVLAARAINILK